jgi:hypothetical protein
MILPQKKRADELLDPASIQPIRLNGKACTKKAT